LAEDLGLNIYYKDTDSFFIYVNEMRTLEKVFNKRYQRELIGIQLGQFHPYFYDFEKNIYLKIRR